MQQTLDARQDRRHIIRRGPAVLQDVEAELAVGVDVRMEHAREEFDSGRLVWVGFVEGECQLEGAVFERRFSWQRMSQRRAGRELG